MIADLLTSLIRGPDAHAQHTHVQQQSSWDCGLACARMALRFARREEEEEAEVMRMFEGAEQPLWSIDICHILRLHEVRFAFFTLCTGVNPQHFDDPWYRATNIREDEQRVEQLFERAKEEAWAVEKRSLEMQQLLAYLGAGQMIVILVNVLTMQGQECSGAFRGHYIALTDVDASHEFVSYLDPSFTNVVHTVKVDILERARLSPGTDQDVIVVFR